jgi:hypothetical protein
MTASMNTQIGNVEQTMATQAGARSDRFWLLSLVLAPFRDVDQRATDEFLNRYKRNGR